MALQIDARFIAAAVLSGMLAAPQALALGSGGQPAPVQLADYEAGKEVPLGEAGQASKKGHAGKVGQAGKAGKTAAGQAGGDQTARTPEQGGGGDDGGFGAERPAPEGPDPNAPESGNGEKRRDEDRRVE